MDDVLRSVVLPFCARTSDSTRPRTTIPERTSLEPTKQGCAHWLVSSLIRYVYNFNMSINFWTEGLTHNNDIKKPPASRCSVAGDIDADPSAPNHQYSEYAKSVLAQFAADWGHTRYWWRHSHLRNVMLKAIKLISCDIQRNFISSFENLHAFYVFMKEYSVVNFAKNAFDPWATWHSATTKVLVLAN